MNTRKFHPIHTITKLFDSADSRAIERNLRAQKKAEAYYTTTLIPRICGSNFNY